MKNLFIRILLFVCSVVALAEGIFFFMVVFGRVAMEDVISFYGYIMQTQKAPSIILGFGSGYVLLGFLLLKSALQHKKKQRVIIVKEKGEILRIPLNVIQEVVEQVLEQVPSVSDFDVSITNKRKRLYLNISLAFNSTISVRQEIHQIYKLLEDEIARVFEFPHLEFKFQIKSFKTKEDKLISPEESSSVRLGEKKHVKKSRLDSLKQMLLLKNDDESSDSGAMEEEIFTNKVFSKAEAGYQGNIAITDNSVQGKKIH